MLPKRHRLKIPDFWRISSKFFKTQSSSFDLFVKKKAKETPQIAILVLKSIEKKATARNEARRVMIEAAREALPGIRRGVYLLIKTRKKIRKNDRIRVQKELLRVLKNQELLKDL